MEGQDARPGAPGGLSTAETFAILGDETRLNVVEALWDAEAHHVYDDVDDGAKTVSYSELRAAVGVDDNGRFNYHLSKLVPAFVRKTTDGYRLSGAGRRFARTVVSLAGAHDGAVSGEPTAPCPACGGVVAAAYEDSWLRFSCRDCGGLFGDAAPQGTLVNAPFPTPGLVGRDADAALATELYRCMLDLASMMRGVCPECASAVSGRLEVCPGHDATPESPCSRCRTPFVAWGDLHCGTCRYAKRLPVELCVLGLAPVIGLLYEAGIDALAPTLDDLFGFVTARVTTTPTDDGRGVTTTVRGDDGELAVSVDEHLRAVAVAH
jgi:ribosomal protein S27AE